jgi:general secretion pathway protein G
MNKKKQHGFTLIEVMVVVVILAILASIIVPRIIGRPDEAKVVKAKQDILAIESALELYKLDNGFYPSTDQGLQALVKRSDSQPEPRRFPQGGYLKRLYKDPWGRAYQYLNPGVHGPVDVYSYGANGKPDGSGVDATIGNWNVEDKDS